MSDCIVIFAHRKDVHAERLCSEISNLGVKAFRIDAEDIGRLRITFRDGNFVFHLSGDTFHANDVRSVFVRRRPSSNDFGITEKNLEVDLPEFIAIQKEVLCQDALFSLQASARFYNSLDASTRFLGKLSQEQIAKSSGLDVAEMLVACSDHEAIAFIQRVRQRGARVCTKPLAQKYLKRDGKTLTRYTEILPDSIDIEAEDFESCPIIFQEYIEKDYEIRVTVADEKLLAVRIDSQHAPGETKTDWRRYNIPKTPHSIYKVPDDLASKIIKFHKLTGLRYSAFDFIKSTDGRYIFLETNPLGQWLWLEDVTGLAITHEIASALCA